MNTFKTPDRATKSAHTRQAVLDAARVEFEAHGFDGANIRAIATRAGVAAGTVIHHHGDKRELLHAALFDDLDVVLHDAIAGLAAPNPDANAAVDLAAQFHGVAVAVFAHYEARPVLSKALLKESLFADPPWAQRFAAQATDVHQALTAAVAAAVARGALASDTDPVLTATSWLAFFYFGLISWVQGAVTAPVPFVDALTANLLAPHTRPATHPASERRTP